MKISLPPGMADAARLTRSGRLTEATALIQSLLGTPPAPAPAAEGIAAGRPAEPPRTRLGETLRRIRAGGMAQSTPPAGTEAPPEGARFTTHGHTGPAGTRAYKLYRPASLGATGERPPLVIMLHGCTQTPDDFARGTGMNRLAETHRVIVAYPAQPNSANAQKCWNWFNPADQQRDRGEPAILAGITRDILREEGADPDRVYVAGLSAGGAAAAILAAAYPDIYAAAGVHSGLPVGAASDVPTAFAAMRSGAAGVPTGSTVPLIVFHGEADATVAPRNGTAVLAQALAAQPPLDTLVRAGIAAGGRSFRQTRHLAPDGRNLAEHWSIAGAGHAWSGGSAAGSHTDPEGPDASAEMLRFFLQHRRPA